MASLKWAPLPDGRPWWPCIVVDRDALDATKHAEIIQFYNNMREKRGTDDLNKDVLVLLCGLSKQDGGHRFAIVPKTSLRNFQLYANAFSDGIISSGVNAGKPCNSEDRKQLRAVIASLGDLSKRAHGAPLPPPPPPPVSAFSSTITSGTSTKTSRASKAMLDENKELVKLRKELQGVRRKMNSRSSSRPQSASPPTYDRAVSPVGNVPQLEATAAAGAAQSKFVPGQIIAEYYPEMTSQIIRMWDFCHSFSQELSLSQPGTRTEFASITSFEAAMAEPDCALFAQVASSLANYISVSKGSELVDQWNFSEDKLSAKLGSRCTPLTWECLWDTLVEKEMVSKPEDPNNKRDILDSLVQACCQLYSTKHVFGLRQSELASELSNAIDFQNSLPALQTQTEIRSLASPDVMQLRVLTGDVFQCKDFFTVERLIDACRADHEVVDPETGRVVARTPELCSAMAWEEKLFAGLLSMIKRTQLAKRTRSLSFGKDPYGRSLFSFIGDDEEEDCRVWAREDATDRWYLYRGDFNLAHLADLVQEPPARQMIVAILYSSKQRYRPASVAEHREAKLNGWMFGGNDLLGRRVLHYTPEFGVIPGVIASWRNVGQTQPRYRVVFTRQVWQHGMDMTNEEVMHLLACSDRPLGDFPMLALNFTLPPHPFRAPWMPVASNESGFVLIPGHQKKLIGLGVIVARTAPLAEGECDVLVLQDGGEFVTIFGKKQLTDAITLANTFAMRPVTAFVDNIPVPRYPQIDRFRPLTHHCGPLVGLQGVIKLWGKIAVDSVTDLREPMLTSEQAFVIRAPALWPSTQTGETWRKFVQHASQVKEFALALECLLFYAEKAVEKGYFTPPPPPTSTPGGEGAAQDGTIASASIASVGGSSSSSSQPQQEEVRSVASPFKRQRQAEAVGDEELDDDMGALEEEMKSAERAIAATIESIQSSSSNTNADSTTPKVEQQDAKVKTERDDAQMLLSSDGATTTTVDGIGAQALSVEPVSNESSSQVEVRNALVLPPPEASSSSATTTTTNSTATTTAASSDDPTLNSSKASSTTPRKASISSSSAVGERRSPRIAASPRRPVYSPKERASPRELRSTPRRVLPIATMTHPYNAGVVVGGGGEDQSATPSSKVVVDEESESKLEDVPIVVASSSDAGNVHDHPEVVKMEDMPVISLASSSSETNLQTTMTTSEPGMRQTDSGLTQSDVVVAGVDEPVASNALSSDVVVTVKQEPVESEVLVEPTSSSAMEKEKEEATESSSEQQQSLMKEVEEKAAGLGSMLEITSKGEKMDMAPSSSSSVLEQVSNDQQHDSVAESSEDVAGAVDNDVVAVQRIEGEPKPSTESGIETSRPSSPAPPPQESSDQEVTISTSHMPAPEQPIVQAGTTSTSNAVADQKVDESTMGIELKSSEETPLAVENAKMTVEHDDQHVVQHRDKDDDDDENVNKIATTSAAIDSTGQSDDAVGMEGRQQAGPEVTMEQDVAGRSNASEVKMSTFEGVVTQHPAEHSPSHQSEN